MEKLILLLLFSIIFLSILWLYLLFSFSRQGNISKHTYCICWQKSELQRILYPLIERKKVRLYFLLYYVNLLMYLNSSVFCLISAITLKSIILPFTSHPSWSLVCLCVYKRWVRTEVFGGLNSPHLSGFSQSWCTFFTEIILSNLKKSLKNNLPRQPCQKVAKVSFNPRPASSQGLQYFH